MTAPLASLSSTHQPASKGEFWVGSSRNTCLETVALPVPGPEFTQPGGGGGGCSAHSPCWARTSPEPERGSSPKPLSQLEPWGLGDTPTRNAVVAKASTTIRARIL